MTTTRIEASVLDAMHDPPEVEDADNRMARILTLDKLSRIPALYLQQIFRHAKIIAVKKKDVVVEQDTQGDYYYIIQEGRCEVTRRTSPDTQTIKLADLYEGDSFGEEALITRGKRSATVTMATDGALVRLAKADFVEFIKKPLLNSVTFDEALGVIRSGAVWLDVRYPDERKHSAMASIINIPLNVLRFQAQQLDPEKHYIVCCDTGDRSAVAAFVLAQRGLDVRYLSGGLSRVEQERSAARNRPREARRASSSQVEALEVELKEALDAKTSIEERLHKERVEHERELRNLRGRLQALEDANLELRETVESQRSNPTMSRDALRNYVKRQILAERQKFQQEREQHAAELDRLKRE